ncbi:MAG TPA: ATP cone domain-containing protein [Candidatus Eisenbacteria bacterium]|nr:ATP cone domain-containing protein [Candidatus Eisenbacteria bacterium]
MVHIVKANGEKEEFSEEKVVASIARAGIPENMQQEVLAHVLSQVHEDISTKDIYKHIVEFLGKKEDLYHKAKYSLKQAIMDLGPTGYPFEDYLSTLLTAEGFTTTVRNVLLGNCISHEIDVIATKEEDKLMVEAKFHNSTGVKTDVHVALYTYARFEDVAKKHGFTKPLLITNTKITLDVITYAQCVGMDVISWDYPEGNSLREIVDTYGLFPITALSRLPNTYKQELLKQGHVLCKDIVENPMLINQLSLSEEDKQHILTEAKALSQKASS